MNRFFLKDTVAFYKIKFANRKKRNPNSEIPLPTNLSKLYISAV